MDLNQVALRNINLSIRELESSILRLAPSAPGGLESISWPFGYSPPSKHDTRFSVLHWEYFNETHIFFDTEHSVVKPLSGPYLEDIQVYPIFSFKILIARGEIYIHTGSYKCSCGQGFEGEPRTQVLACNQRLQAV